MTGLSHRGTTGPVSFELTAQRDKRGSIIGPALIREIARRAAVPMPETFTFQAGLPLDDVIGEQGGAFKIAEGRAELSDGLSLRVSQLLGMERRDIWPRRFGPAALPEKQLARPVPKERDLTAALASARAFRVAIDALPVGKDIRTRLLAHLDEHIAAIEAIR